jgi:hypothetical protein
VLVEPFAGNGPALLWAISQCEERFFAAQRSAFARYPKNFIGF